MVETNNGEGRIVILSKSRFEMLDGNELHLLRDLKTLNRTLGLTSRLGSHLHELFTRSHEPHVLAMKLAYCCGDFNSCKAKSLAVFIITKIYDLMKANAITAPTDPEIKIDALNLILEQKNTGFRDLVIEAFDVKSHRENCIPLIRTLIQKNRFKDACQVTQSLKLFQHFSLEEFIIPLCLQDKEPVVEAYMRSDKKSLHDFLKFMDHLLPDDAYVNYFNEILQTRQIPFARMYTSRSLARFLNRLMKSSNEPSDVCPNLIRRNLRGTMRFYLAKRFETNNPVSEGWSEMIFEVVGGHRDLQKELVEALYERGCYDEALQWVRKYDLPEELWPQLLFKHIDEGDGRVGAKDSSNSSEQHTYYTLPRDDMVVIVENSEEFEAFLAAVAVAKVVSFDTEWKPSFSYVENEISLLQIATHHKIFILDRMALVQNVPHFSAKVVEKLFHNKDILKVGFSVGGDVRLLKSCFPELKDIYSLLDLFDLRKVLVATHKFKFPFSANTGELGGKLLDLSQLTLGKTLDKTEQCSNWEKRPLRASQIAYAAVDAYCLLEIYDVICSECERQDIPIKDVLQELQTGRSPQREPKSSVSVKDFRMVCTWELCRLVKRLRSCGIDACYNNAQHATKRTLKLLKKGYIVLTTVDQSWLKSARCVRVPVADEKTQLLHVLEKYGIQVNDVDINTRCRDCNKTDFMEITAADLRNMQEREQVTSHVSNGIPAGMEDEENDDDDDDIDEEDDEYYDRESVARPTGDDVQLLNYWTRNGASIAFQAVPSDVLEKFEVFSVCEWCGIVYWKVTFEDLFLYD